MDYRKYYPVIFITVVVLIAVFLLALTENATWYKLEVQQDQSTLDTIKKIFPEANRYSLDNDIYTIYDNSRSEIGYAFYATGQGFGGKIVILVGLEDKDTIMGINIISHEESEDGWMNNGWGNRITESYFINQFIGLNVYDCELNADNGKINALTGATISSKSVVDIVQKAAIKKIESIR
jgi:electron transport complex protein RnfG